MSLGLTINGIDGFLSGNWLFDANATVVDDETLVLNATGDHASSNTAISVIPNTTYTIKAEHNAYIAVYNMSAQVISSYSTNHTITFNSGNNNMIKVYVSNFTLGAGTFTFKRPMLNLGSTPAPYEKKRGDRMVLPVFNGDGTVQINKKPLKRTTDPNDSGVLSAVQTKPSVQVKQSVR